MTWDGRRRPESQPSEVHLVTSKKSLSPVIVQKRKPKGDMDETNMGKGRLCLGTCKRAFWV